FPIILSRTPYDKSERRFSEIGEFFPTQGFVVVLQDVRDRYRSQGTNDYLHSGGPLEGRDGYDTVSWITEQKWSNGKVGTVGSSYGGHAQIRMALERPPGLAAVWPDVSPTNAYHNQTREGGAMQLHMFWALFLHAQDAQDVADAPEKRAELWDEFRRL